MSQSYFLSSGLLVIFFIWWNDDFLTLSVKWLEWPCRIHIMTSPLFAPNSLRESGSTWITLRQPFQPSILWSADYIFGRVHEDWWNRVWLLNLLKESMFIIFECVRTMNNFRMGFLANCYMEHFINDIWPKVHWHSSAKERQRQKSCVSFG